MKPEVSDQEKINRKKRWKIIGFMTVCEFLIVTIIAYAVYAMGWYEVSSKDELIKITGIIEKYERIYTSASAKGSSSTTNEYRIYLQNGDVYYMSGYVVPVFNRRDFEFYNHKGDEVTLWIDPNENTEFKPLIAEVWGEGEVCYLSYEDYKEVNDKNSKQHRIFSLFYIPLCIGLCIYINVKIYKKIKKEDTMVYYI